MRRINEEDKIALLNEIKRISKDNTSDLLTMSKYSIASYFKSLFKFGRKSEVTKDNINVFREFWKIISEEDAILNYVSNNIDNIDLEAATRFIEKLDILNTKTISHYYGILDNIEKSCDTLNTAYASRSSKDFSTLTETVDFHKEAVALTEKEERIRELLGYEENFWSYFDRIVKRVNAKLGTLREKVYVDPIYDKDDLIGGVSLLAPEVVDLDTALLAIEIYEKAYITYHSINHRNVLPCNDTYASNEYEETYLTDKARLIFERK